MLSPTDIDPVPPRPLEVLADPQGNPLTADYDLLALGHHEHGGSMIDDVHRGLHSEADGAVIERLNKQLRHQNGPLIHHGAEVANPFSARPSYPITVFDPDHGELIIRQAAGADPDAHLKRFFHLKRLEGYDLTPNPRWNWGEWSADAPNGWKVRSGAAGGTEP